MRLHWKWFAVGGAALASLGVAYLAVNPYVLAVFSAKPLKPPTPPILKDGGGRRLSTHISGCPPWAPMDLQHPGSIEDRVEKAFPSGTPQDLVVRSLSQQGFKVEASCASDPSIRYATFNQGGGGLYGPYPAYSVVTWKVDLTGKVIWATGTVAYTYTGP